MDIQTFIEQDLQLRGKPGSSGWYRICCPFHGEKNPSAAVHMEYPYNFGCLACGEKGSIVKLTAHVKKISNGAARDYVKGLLEISGDDIDRLIGRGAEKKRIVPTSVVKAFTELLPGSIAMRYANDRGIPPYILRLFNVGYDDAEKALMIPIYSVANLKDAVGFDMRMLHGDEVQKFMEVAPKQRNRALIFPVNLPSFDCEGIIVVEGFFDAARVMLWLIETDQHRKYTVAATCGNQPSQHHARFFGKFNRVCLGFDADKGGDKARKKLAELLPSIPFRFLKFDGADPGESSEFSIVGMM